MYDLLVIYLVNGFLLIYAVTSDDFNDGVDSFYEYYTEDHHIFKLIVMLFIYAPVLIYAFIKYGWKEIWNN